jgi:uncharacterized membrane protein YjgN (DUF898 family)
MSDEFQRVDGAEPPALPPKTSLRPESAAPEEAVLVELPESEGTGGCGPVAANASVPAVHVPATEPPAADPAPTEPSAAPAQNSPLVSGMAEAAAAPPVVLPSAPPAPVAHPIVFHGRSDEYFRIWIVNTLLTLLTCGVFFAWAKVRKRRYLRGSTELLGHRFDYRARPVRLLIGHIVVLIFFLGYSLFGVVYPAVRFGVLGLGVVLLPWIVVRSFTFNAHSTVYRGLRFRFNSSLSAALKVYLLEPLLIPVTLGFYYPNWQRSKRAYAVAGHRFGDTYFHFTAPAGRFYSTYIFAGLIVLGAFIIATMVLGLIFRVGHITAPSFIQLVPFVIVYAFGFFVARHLIYARLFNHIWNHTRIDEHRFQADLKVAKWLGLQLTNLGAILVSAGLLYPWAVIRAQRYAASCLHFLPAAAIDNIQRVGGSGGSATGDMAAEFIGIDFGL